MIDVKRGLWAGSRCVRPTRRAATITVFWMLATVSAPTAAAQVKDNPVDPELNAIIEQRRALLQLALGSPEAMRIARERYQMVHRFGATHGGWPIGHMLGSYKDSVFFPAGRSDKMYVLLHKPPAMYCYERLNGKDRLNYRVRLTDRRRYTTGDILTKPRPLTSLLNLLTTDLVLHSGRLKEIYSTTVLGSRFAKRDLATRQEYVQYDYEIPVSELVVSMLWDRDAKSFDANQTWFDLDTDPITNTKLYTGKIDRDGGHTEDTGQEEFYKKYGLPLARKELEQLTHRHL